jgi:Putative transposase
MTLEALEFLRRFVQHVLPHGFTKIRHYGLLANRFRAERLTTSRRLLLAAAVMPTSPASPLTEPQEPIPERACPQCGSRRFVLVALPPLRSTDTS